MTRFGSLQDDHLQVLLLGPGFGESVIVRAPGDPPGWLVVDSLLNDRRHGGRSAVLEALEDLGAEPDLVVLTHAHADHAAGMDLIVERFRERAQFGLLRMSFDDVASARVRSAAQGVETAAALRAVDLLPESRRWHLAPGRRSLGDATVAVLHPSAARLDELKQMSSVGPNQFSSALMIEWREQTILLGADLERPEWAGLAAAAALHASNPVKVPHHGSPGAFDPLWVGDRATHGNAERRMLIAPFNRRPKLPDIDDPMGVVGLLGQVDQVNVTALPFRTTPDVSGTTLPLSDLRAARDAARRHAAPPPALGGEVSPPERVPSERDAWLLAELGRSGACAVRAGAEHVAVRV